MKIHCLYDALVAPSELKPNPRNPNRHSEAQIERLAKILDYQGFRYAIKVSKLSGFITSGHGRLEAAKALGLKHVPVVYQDYENEDQEYADIVADNSIASWSELDLSSINLEIPEMGPDFEIDLLGIKDFTIDIAEKLDPQCDEDEIPEKVEPKTKLGDIYRLGRHRLMCGDSTSIDAVEKLMEGEKADMVFTDPPYNTGMKPNSGSTRLSHMFNDSFTEEEWSDLLRSMSTNYWAFTQDSSVSYVCLDWRRSHEIIPFFKEAGFKFSNLIVWDKMVHGLGSDYKYTHEFIHVFKKGAPDLVTNHGEEDYRDIWHIQRKMGKDEEHATKKPISLIERALKHNPDSKKALDLFGGSGSTLIACEKTNRKCFMMELDPHYCDVIVARWEKYTGNKSELITNQGE